MTMTPTHRSESSDVLIIRPTSYNLRWLSRAHYGGLIAVAATILLAWFGVSRDGLSVYVLIAGLTSSISGFATISPPTARLRRIERELRVQGLGGPHPQSVVADGRLLEVAEIKQVRLARELVRWIRYWVPGYHLLLVLRSHVLLIDTFRETGEGNRAHNTATSIALQLARALNAPLNQAERAGNDGLTLGFPSHALTPWLLPAVATFVLTLIVGLSDSFWVVTVSALSFIVVVRVAVLLLERSAARLMPSHDAKIVAEFELEAMPPAVRS